MRLPTLVRVFATVGAVVLVVGVLSAANPDDVAKLKSTGSCAGCDLFGENLSALQIPSADLTNANLSEAMLYGANLQGANFTGANLDGANFSLANLTGATGVVFHNSVTDERTTCPDGSAGPCAQ
jgi:uncharacterized protein YjbI with pentapeptide repeats